LFSISALSYRYAGAAPLCFPDFAAPQGAWVRLSGASGSGKSTLLALLAGLLAVQAGRVTAGGVELSGLGARERDAWRGATLGFVPQRLHLSESLSVADNLALPYVAAGLAVDRQRIDGVLCRLGLAGLARRRPAALSVGQAQRVALARALLRAPKLILADEPTANLDDNSAQAALALLGDVAAAEQATLVVATHDRRLAELWPQSLHLHLHLPQPPERADDRDRDAAAAPSAETTR
jgi:putative ABC transport system ATP-binding protein